MCFASQVLYARRWPTLNIIMKLLPQVAVTASESVLRACTLFNSRDLTRSLVPAFLSFGVVLALLSPPTSQEMQLIPRSTLSTRRNDLPLVRRMHVGEGSSAFAPYRPPSPQAAQAGKDNTSAGSRGPDGGGEHSSHGQGSVSGSHSDRNAQIHKSTRGPVHGGQPARSDDAASTFQAASPPSAPAFPEISI